MWHAVALRVLVRCPNPEVAFEGVWPKKATPEEVLRDCVAKAKARGVPIYLEVKGHGAWRIAPSGKVARHIRFLRSPR